MRTPKDKKSIVRKVIYTLIIAFILSISGGIFLFDMNLIVYKRSIQDASSIYSNLQNLLPLIKYSLLFFIGISFITILLSFLLRAKRALNYIESLNYQITTFIPFLFLAFGRFFYGKAFKFSFFFSMFPLFIGIILAIVVHLNLILYFDFNAFRFCYIYLKNNSRNRRRILSTFMVLFLCNLLISKHVDRDHFERFTSHRLFIGDEPKYIRMTYSLATDKNLDVSDEFVVEEGLEVAKKRILEKGSRKFGSLSIIGKDEKIYHIHMPGLSALILPGFILDMSIFPSKTGTSEPGLRLEKFPSKLLYTRLCLLMIGIFSFFLLARLIFRFFNSQSLLITLLLLFIFSSPGPDFMFQIYPEFAASLFTLLVLNALLFPFKNKYLNYLFIVLGIGFLPWLHQRFILISLGLYSVLIINEIILRKNYKKVVILSLLLIVTSLPYFYYFYSITGSPMPNSMYKLLGRDFLRIGMFPFAFFGHLFDHSRGMIWLYPWTALALIGIYWGLKFDQKRTIMLLTVFAPYYLLTCFHFTWHGVTKEPGRFLVAIFPLLLFFLAYTIKAFVNRPKYLPLFFYTAILVMAVLNKNTGFLYFEFVRRNTVHSQIIQFIECIFIIGILFSSAILSDKLSDKNFGSIPLNKITNYLTGLYSGIKNSFLVKRIPKSIIPLLLLFLIAYLLVFIKNWDTRTMSTPFLTSLYKMNSYRSFQMAPKEKPEEIVGKSDRNFVKIFESVYNFQKEPSSKTTVIPLENTSFYVKAPRGCYEVKLELDTSFQENEFVELSFLGKIKKLDFTKSSKGTLASAIYFLFEEKIVSPRLKLMFPYSVSKQISGKLEIRLIPCLVFSKDLILRPIPKSGPKPVRKEGKNQYKLVFIANTNEVRKKYRFYLYTQKFPHKINRKEEVLLASTEEVLTKKGGPSIVNIKFLLTPSQMKKNSALALFVQDAKNNLLNCKSLLLKTNKKSWSLIKNPNDFNRFPFD